MADRPAQEIAPRWREAAVLGSLWAAAEIVLGSFLHNLRVPLRGHIMTSIGVVLLVAGHRRWPLGGLIWRAGLIAAAMKSVSPSAVVLGPMLAIAMEGLVMELGARLAPRRLAGYLIGGALAMSWTLAQRLLSLVITYGANILTVYSELVAWAERQLGEIPLGAWGPIAALGVVNLLVGGAAAATGWSVAATPPLGESELGVRETPVGERRAAQRAGRPSLLALALVVALLPAGMIALGTLPLGWAAAVVGGVALLAVVRYPAAVRRLRRPSFWLSLAALTAVSGLAFAATRDGAARWEGLAIGTAMSLRAVYIALVFTALGSELANPVIRDWMARRGAAPYLAALETGFAALPEAIAALPPARTLLRHPRRSVASLLPHLERWLAREPSARSG